MELIQVARLFCCVAAWSVSWVRASPSRFFACVPASPTTEDASSAATWATWRPLSRAS